MRDGILNQLPESLPREKVVFVVGSDNVPGIGAVKSLIQDLNRSGEWIRAEFRSSKVAESQISEKVGVVLTMVGTAGGSVVNARRAAETHGAHCPNQALTVGETKTILQLLARVRQGLKPSILSGGQNGDSSRPVPGKSETQRLAELSAAAAQLGEGFSSAVSHEPGTDPATVLPEGSSPVASREPEMPPLAEIANEEEAAMILDPAPEYPCEVVAALTAIEKFRGSCDETQSAVLMIGDRLKEVMAERDGLQDRLGARDEEVAALRSQLEEVKKVAEENADLLAKNEELEGEVVRLKKALENLHALINGALQKNP